MQTRYLIIFWLVFYVILSVIFKLSYLFYPIGPTNIKTFYPFYRIASLIPGFLITSLGLILCDSLYYGDLTFRKMWDMSMDWSDWKCTPMHFIMYNLVPGNLDKHGTHPWYLHLVNLLMLFGPLGIIALWSGVQFFGEMISKIQH